MTGGVVAVGGGVRRSATRAAATARAGAERAGGCCRCSSCAMLLVPARGERVDVPGAVGADGADLAAAGAGRAPAPARRWREAGWWYAAHDPARVRGDPARAWWPSPPRPAASRSPRCGPARPVAGACAALVFVLVLAGFGSKAGLVPLHVWLPRAHPEAPSHVSALMSRGDGQPRRVRHDPGRVRPARRRAALVVAARAGCSAALSALYGILQAAVATDLKRLLAYSTTENMGLIFVGLGAAGCCRARRRPALAALALAAALLHVRQPRRRSRRCCSSPPVRCCARPAPATWTPSAGCARGCRPRRSCSRSARSARRRCRRATASSPSGCCCSPWSTALPAGGVVDRGRDAARGRGGGVDRRAGGGDVRQGVRRRVPCPPPQRRRRRRRGSPAPACWPAMGVAGAGLRRLGAGAGRAGPPLSPGGRRGHCTRPATRSSAAT